MLVTSNDIEKVEAEEVTTIVAETGNGVGHVPEGIDAVYMPNSSTNTSDSAASDIGNSDNSTFSELEEGNESGEDNRPPDGSFNPGTIFSGMFGNVLPGLGGLNIQKTDENGNPIPGEGPTAPDYSQLFETYGKLFEQQDKNIEYLNGAINNLISQLNKYKRNQSWKLRIMCILLLIAWVIMFIKM